MKFKAYFVCLHFSRKPLPNKNRHTGIPGLWTQELGAGLWTLDSGSWTLDSERWTLDAGLWTLNARL